MPDAAVDLETVLSELGDRALIAAGIDVPPARASEPTTPSRRFVDSRAGVVVTLIVLVVGALSTQLIVWLVGVVLLWASGRWRIVDKVIGTLASPVLLVGISLPYATTTWFGGGVISGAWICTALAFGWLIARAFWGRGRGGVNFAPRQVTAREGAAGAVDRWPGAVAAIALTSAAPAIAFGTALIRRDS